MIPQYENTTTVRYTTRSDIYTSPADHQQSDYSEQQEVLLKLKQRSEGRKSSQAIVLLGAAMDLEPGSSLADALQPGVNLLRKLSETAAFKTLLGRFGLSEYSMLEVTTTGELNVGHTGNKTDIANALKRAPDLEDDFKTLVEMASLTGGCISLADSVQVEQWLKFHHYLIPRTAAEAARLSAFMQMKLPASPTLGNYWEMIKVTSGNSVTLSAAQRSEWRQLISSYIKDQSLLEHLSDNVFGGRSAFKRSEAEDALEKLISSPIAFVWANAYVRDLGWYGAQPNQPQTEDSLKQIVLTALLLDLHPDVGEHVPRNQVAGFNLYAVEHMEQSFADIQTQFERHLVAHHRISMKNAALAAQLLLAEAAPEFLVKDQPPGLLVGTAQWVEFCRLVALQEIIAPGSTRSMTYAQIRDLAKFDSISETRNKLSALAAVDPIIDWALLNQIVTTDDVAKSVTHSFEVALAAYARHAETLADTATVLSRPLPTRRSVSLQILEQVAKGCSYLESDVLYQISNRPLEDAYADPFPVSPVDLHMSNDLVTGDWDRKNGESIYAAFPRMRANLIPPDREFYRQFNREYVIHTQAMHTHVKQALTSLPMSERIRLLKGKVTIFTVRPSVAKLQTISSLPANPISSVIDSIVMTTQRKPTESHKEIDEAKGRYGVVIYCEHEGQGSCYELFTLQGVCRENAELAALIQHENLLNPAVRPSGLNYSAPATVHRLPTDVECYTHGVTPGLINISSGVIDKIGELSAAPPAQINGYYQSFYSTEFDRLVNFVLKHRPVATYDELVKECWGQTRLEALRNKRDKDLEAFLNVIVPFKSCIADLTSDDVERQVRGAAACTLEAAMTVLLVVAAIAKIAAVVAKGVSVATKAAKIASTSVGLVSSVVNPLDGATDLLFQGAKFLRKGWLSGSAALEGALHDARKWIAKPPYNALSTAVDTDAFRLGTRRYAQNSTDLFQVWGIHHADEWYAVNRLGEPWGPKLKNLKLANFLRNPLKRAQPYSYTRGFLKKAIPHAKSKIDNAIQLISDAHNDDVRSVILHMFGIDSPEAIERITHNLRNMRKDLDSFSLDNVYFQPEKGTSTVAAVYPGIYKRWKAAIQSNAKLDVNSRAFMDVYPDNLDEFYKVAYYDDARVGDIFVHEMSHGAPDTLDFYYGDILADAIPAEYNAVGLLQFAKDPHKASPKNLFNIHFRFMEPKGFKEFEETISRWPKIVQEHPALLNAESYAVAVSLIDQYKTSPGTFKFNLSVITNTIKNTPPGEFIPGPLLLNLAKPAF